MITMNKQVKKKWRGMSYLFIILHSGLSAVTEIRNFFTICSVIGKFTRETNVATPLSPTPFLSLNSHCQSIPTVWQSGRFTHRSTVGTGTVPGTVVDLMLVTDDIPVAERRTNTTMMKNEDFNHQSSISMTPCDIHHQ
jgi:hypothetical protein